MFIQTSLRFARLRKICKCIPLIQSFFFLLHKLFFIYNVKVSWGFASFRLHRECVPCPNQLTGSFLWSRHLIVLLIELHQQIKTEKNTLDPLEAVSLYYRDKEWLWGNFYPTEVSTSSYDSRDSYQLVPETFTIDLNFFFLPISSEHLFDVR